MRDDVMEVLKREAARSHRDAAFAVLNLVADDETPLRAVGAEARDGDCIALLTPRRLLVGGGGIDRAYDLTELATAVVVSSGERPVFYPVSMSGPADMFYVGADGADFAAEVRKQLVRIRPPRVNAPIWERPEFTHVIRLEDAGLLVAPKDSPVRSGQVVIVSITSVGVQIRHTDGSSGVLVPWRDVLETRVEGVEQVQTRPSVGAVLVFGVLGLAARRKEKRAYLTFQTREGDYLIEDAEHLPLELRALLAPFGVSEKPSVAVSTGWEYRQLSGRDDDQSLWDRLGDLGAEGWELVSAVASADGLVLILKRPTTSKVGSFSDTEQ